MTTDQTPPESSLHIETDDQRRKRLRSQVEAAKAEDRDRRIAVLDQWAEHQEEFSWRDDARIDPDVFRSSPRFMSQAVARFIRRSSLEPELAYATQPERRPYNFASNEVAEDHLRRCKIIHLQKMEQKNKGKNVPEHLSLPDAIDVFIASRLGSTVMTFEGYDAQTLLMYDYDKKLYTYSQNQVARWLTVLTGSASRTNIFTFVQTLEGMGDKLAIFNPPPRWKIPVGNGLYNTLTRKLEPHSPIHVVTNRVQTDYKPRPTEPSFTDGMTFEKLVYDLADGQPDRVELIMQMCKTIITGYAATPAIFVMMGSGGDGKSVFMSLLSNIVGASNTGAMNFSDMDDESKVVEVAQKRLVVGMDNNKDVTVKNTALLKSAASREVLSLFRKYLTSVSLRFTGSVVQLCNNLPRFTETGSSIRRRIVMLLCENSHYESGDEKSSLQENIKNKHWLEYILWYILNESTNPYYTDFNDYDRGVVNNSLDEEDTIGSFYADLASTTDALNHDVLPRKFLYAAYLDWMQANYPGSRVKTSRNFASASDSILRAYGFEPSQDRNPTRMSTLEKTTGISFSTVFGYMADGQNVRELTEASSRDVTRIMQRTGAVKNTNRNGRRFPKVCSAIQYFAVWDEIISDIEHHPLAYKDVFESEGIDYSPEDVFDGEDAVIVDPADVSTFADDALGEKFHADYLSYMSDHKIAVREGEDGTRAEDTGRLAERVARSVQESQTAFQAKLAPGEEQLLPEMFDPATATATEFDEASDAELLDRMEQVTERAGSDKQIAARVMGMRLDLTAALNARDSERVDQIMDWLDRCAEVAQANGMDIGYASLVDRLSASVVSVAQSNGSTTLATKLSAVADDDVDVRVEEVKKASYTIVGSVSKMNGGQR